MLIRGGSTHLRAFVGSVEGIRGVYQGLVALCTGFIRSAEGLFGFSVFCTHDAWMKVLP